MLFIPNDHVLINYHFVPIVISYFRHFWSFTQLGWLYKPPYDFCNPNFHFYASSPAALVFRLYFALFSLLFLSFSWLPNTPLEDENARDAWLSLKALKRRVTSLVVGGLAVSSCFKWYMYCIYGFKLSKLGFNAI